MKEYDIFISYRRKDRHGKPTGITIARSLQQSIERRGYDNRVFFDHKNITNENFGNKILSAIARSKVFLLVLTENAMDGCANENDWVRREILEAERVGLAMIFIDIDKEFDGKFPKDFPDVLSVVRETNHIIVHTDTSYDRDIDALVQDYIDPVLTSKDAEPSERVSVTNYHNAHITSVFKFYSDIDCEIYKEGKLICKLEKYSEEPFTLPVTRKGEYRFKCRLANGKSVVLNRSIDNEEEKIIHIKNRVVVNRTLMLYVTCALILLTNVCAATFYVFGKHKSGFLANQVEQKAKGRDSADNNVATAHFGLYDASEDDAID